MSSRIISFELVVMFFMIVPVSVSVLIESQRLEVVRTSTPVENKKDTVLFRYFKVSLCVQPLGRWIEFP